MNVFGQLLLGLGAFCLASSAHAEGAGGRLNTKALSGEPLTTTAIRHIYTNHTWVWGKRDGGYFSARKQRFEGIARSAGYTSRGEGVWFVPGNGKLCFRATWHTGDKVSSKLDCFEHRKKGRIVYQRRDKGDWYVFQGAPRGQWNEISKLRPGNRIGNAFAGTKK